MESDISTTECPYKPTKIFKKKKVECFTQNTSPRRKIYDMVVYDSPGYDKNRSKDWIQNILIKINEKVLKIKIELRTL